MLRGRISTKWIKRLWKVERVLVILFVILLLISIGLGALFILSQNPQYYFGWYFLTTSVATYVITDYVVLHFEKGGNKWKDYKLLRFAFFFLGIIASAEVADFLTVAYAEILDSPLIGWVIFGLTIAAIVIPWFYFEWKAKVSEEAQRTTTPEQSLTRS